MGHAQPPLFQEKMATGSMVEIKRILVPLDRSQLAETALPLALSLAEKYQAQLILLHALEPTTSLAYATQPATLKLYARLIDRLSLEAELYLREHQQQLRQQGYEVEIEVAKGLAAEAVIEAAILREIDLIVMSTHGRGGLARWTTGSVADKVLRHSPCPVLLVRQGIRLD